MINTAENLTSNYKTDEDSNNYKLLSLSNDGLNELSFVLSMIEAYRDLDNAKGLELDRKGKSVLEFRDGDEDEAFRKRISVKIKSNFKGTDIESLNETIAILLGDAFERIGETWNSAKYNHEPAGLYIRTKNINTTPELTGNEKRLDGAFYLNGDYYLNGGYEVLVNYNPLDRLDTIKKVVSLIVAGGVRLYWEVPQTEIIQAYFNVLMSVSNTIRRKVQGVISIDLSHKNIVSKQKDYNSLPYVLNGELFLNGSEQLDGRRQLVVINASVRTVKKNG